MESLKKIWQFRVLVLSKFANALGISMLVWSIIDILVPEDNLSTCCRVMIIVGILAVSILYALYVIFHKPEKLKLEINKRTNLTVEKGDIFKASEKDACVIPVNEYFDTHIGDGIVNPNTLHGKFLAMFANRTAQLRADIDNQLSNYQELPSVRKRTMVEGLPSKRYALGTCVRIMDGERLFILVAITRFNKEEHVEVASEEYPEVIRKMYNGIENFNDGKAVYLPLVGSGISGYQLNEMQMLNTMIQAAYNADKLAITNGMHICIYGDEMWSKLNLNVIEYLFDRWKTLK